MTSRPSTAAPILAVLAIVLVTLGAYVGGYLWLGEYCYRATDKFPYISRTYDYEWQKHLFWPAACAESTAKREAVMLRSIESDSHTSVGLKFMLEASP